MSVRQGVKRVLVITLSVILAFVLLYVPLSITSEAGQDGAKYSVNQSSPYVAAAAGKTGFTGWKNEKAKPKPKPKPFTISTARRPTA